MPGAWGLTLRRCPPRPQVRLARRLALDWQAYVVRTHALRKVFASVKGFYYQVRRRRVLCAAHGLPASRSAPTQIRRSPYRNSDNLAQHWWSPGARAPLETSACEAPHRPP